MSVCSSKSESLYKDNSVIEELVLTKRRDTPVMATPFIITITKAIFTHIDMQILLEVGLQIVRFKMFSVTKEDKIHLLRMLQKAVAYTCEKYDVTTWPIALCIDIPNTCICTGFLADTTALSISLKQGSSVIFTSNVKYREHCTSQVIYIDDEYAIECFEVGTEITFCSVHIIFICVQKINSTTWKCKVVRGGSFGNQEFVCVRGITFKRPALTPHDMGLIAFGVQYQFDIMSIHGVRYAKTLKRIRELLASFCNGKPAPLILSTISEQEGLDNVDEIIENSDGIILAREFMACQIKEVHKMPAIQMQVGAKCRMAGKPFFISGDIMYHTVRHGGVNGADLSDVTNAVIQGAGFFIRDFTCAPNIAKAMRLLNTLSHSVENCALNDNFNKLLECFPVPANAAEAIIVGCGVLVRQTNAVVIIIPTVSGETAKQLVQVALDACVLTVSTDSATARKLHLYKGVVPIIYDKVRKRTFYDEMMSRIKFAVGYGIKKEILKYGDNYVTLRKSTPYSSFCDHLSVYKVETSDKDHHRLKCPPGVYQRRYSKTDGSGSTIS